MEAFLALLLEVSEARSFAILDVFQRFVENVRAWTEGTRDQCACTRRRACVHARMWRCGGAVSKRTYSPGQKEHVISAQHARAHEGAHARMSSGSVRVHTQARMRACHAVAVGAGEGCIHTS